MQWFERALDDHRAGRLDEAALGYRRVLEHEPHHADALYLLGLIEFKRGKADSAAQWIRQAIDINPSPMFLGSLGNVLTAMDDAAGAEAAYRRVIELNPDDVDANLKLGALLTNARRWDEGEALLRHALALDPARAGSYRHLGRSLVLQRRFAEAEPLLRRAIELRPDDARPHAGLAAALINQGRDDEAQCACTTALAIDPQCVDALVNQGLIQLNASRLSEAEHALRAALEVDPGHAIAQFNLSAVLLKEGRYEEGWRLYEARLEPDVRADAPLDGNRSEWHGEPLQGKSIAVLCEQGFGDMLQFCRYLPMLWRLGPARLTIVCPASLTRLLETMDGAPSWVLTSDRHDAVDHDFWCALMSLPLRFGTTLQSIPAASPYLKAPEAALRRWRARLPSGGFKVGLVWAGDSRIRQADALIVDRRRSLHVHDFAPLLKVAGATFVSLQLGRLSRPQIEAIDPQWRPLDPMGEVADFADTAAIVQCLDLVIAVDTSTAHLAGALNCPVWILSRFDGCWRWLEHRDDSPWYPSARLFRQRSAGDWTEVVERVTQALHERLASSA